jgi:hypothetical protein
MLNYEFNGKELDMNGAGLIMSERKRHEGKGYTAEYDDLFTEGQLAKAAACHAVFEIEGDDTFVVEGLGTGSGFSEDAYPWEPALDSRDHHSRIENLVVAGALICAEIDRLQRQASAVAMMPLLRTEGG